MSCSYSMQSRRQCPRIILCLTEASYPVLREYKAAKKTPCIWTRQTVPQQCLGSSQPRSIHTHLVRFPRIFQPASCCNVALCVSFASFFITSEEEKEEEEEAHAPPVLAAMFLLMFALIVSSAPTTRGVGGGFKPRLHGRQMATIASNRHEKRGGKLQL